jgi:CelD/BcsL family acetyltransferase involved in cellulose biosynthesis
MARIVEINDIEGLSRFRQDWSDLLRQTPGASFFQSLPWLEVYWRHFGRRQRLRVLVTLDGDRPMGILPLVVRREKSRVGPVRVLTYPLHDWGSFYGPIGPGPGGILTAGLEHLRRTPHDWDFVELRWQGAPDTDPWQAGRSMQAAGLQPYPTLWDRTAVVDLGGTWETYWTGRKGAWLRRFRHAERSLEELGELSYVRYRPAGGAEDGSARWDLYDACEQLAHRSWQGGTANGTTLSHDMVRQFLRDVHEAGAAAGAVDLNLLLLRGTPVAFVYGYHYQGYVYGLRRGYDARLARQGAGNVLLAYTLRDSFARGDRVYDMGVGSLESKRHFQTRLLPLLRFSYFPPLALRVQLLRLRRWWQGRCLS